MKRLFFPILVAALVMTTSCEDKEDKIKAPELTTTEASEITSSTAVSGGIITNAGMPVYTERGVCYATTENPTVDNTKIVIDGTETGNFTANLTGLIAVTKYYVRAYATSNNGTVYGNEVSFTTSTEPACDCDDISYPNNAKLKRISSIHLGFSNEGISYKPFVTNPKTVWYVNSEYEYDNSGRISKVSCPMYDNGNINGVISYDIYTYNEKSQLEKIMYYNANIYEGFINLRTYTYSYNKDGNKRKEVIVYPRALPFKTDSTIYYYDNNRLKREEKYEEGYFGREPWRSELVTYIEYEYDNHGQLVKQTTYSGLDNTPIRLNEHTYQNGLNVKTEIFNYSNKQKIREIRRYYDENGNLIYLESQELSIFSSALSYISKYEYY